MGVEASKPTNPHSFSNIASNPSISRIDQHVHQRLSKGVSYNLKIILRGNRKVGKSLLFRRLKGQTFIHEVCIYIHISVSVPI